jgi:hypothetical protein
MFKLWSENNPDVERELKPDLWLRSWNDLSSEEKKKIWNFLHTYFFDNPYLESQVRARSSDDFIKGQIFSEIYWWYAHILEKIIVRSIKKLNHCYKHKSYAINFLERPLVSTACTDFYNIFHTEDENVVFELLSLYSESVLEQYSWDSYFSWFRRNLNDVFEDFWLNIILTEQGFVPKQEKKIMEDIFIPVLSFLWTHNKYWPINRELSDAFSDYHNKDYSWAVTKTISSIQAFLQISVDWKLSNLSIKDWINKSKEKGLISNDIFTETIFKNIESVISRERQETWDAHPKRDYANENNARLILNLAMIFMQHFIQKWE